MPDKLERLIKAVYKKWRSAHIKMDKAHPDEETLACFFEGRLSQEENECIKTHFSSCDNCAEAFVLGAKLKIGGEEELAVPGELLQAVKNLIAQKQAPCILEIFLRLKEEALEIINTSGDVLVGQEFIPAPVLRNRKIKDFKDEIVILKDFKGIRVEVKIENKRGQAFNLTVAAKEKKTQQALKNLRITLIKGDLELESSLSDFGKVTFEHVLLGKYTVEITDIEDKLASILIDIKR